MTVDRAVIDTNVVVLLRALDRADLPERPLVTAITLAELAVGPLIARDPIERARRQEHLRFAEQTFPVVPFDADAAQSFGLVAAALRARGRKVAARGFDALIAAVALANDVPLFTTNPDDFSGIDRLTIVSVPVDDSGN